VVPVAVQRPSCASKVPTARGSTAPAGGNHLEFRPHGIDEMTGTMFGMRRYSRCPGSPAVHPAPTNEFLVHRADGSVELVGANESGIHVGRRRLVRDAAAQRRRLRRTRSTAIPAAVLADLEGRPLFHRRGARRVRRGVVDGAVDGAATDAARDELRAARLAAAEPAARAGSTQRRVPPRRRVQQPLYPGVVQQGAVAYAAASGAPLAVAPDHWTDGCPMLVEHSASEGPTSSRGPTWTPQSGRALHTEVALDGAPRTFETSPTHGGGRTR
jgi:N-methylhydantoinase B